MPRARKLISGASFDAGTLAMLGRIFDEVWASDAADSSSMIRVKSRVREYDWLPHHHQACKGPPARPS